MPLNWLKKYLTVSKIEVQRLSAYPTRFFGYLYGSAIVLLLNYFFWKTIFGNYKDIQGYDFSSIMTYYAVALVTEKLTTSAAMSRVLEEDVQYGYLSKFLIKPVSYSLFSFFELYTRKVVNTVAPVLLFCYLIAVYSDVFLKPIHLGLFLISLTFSILLNFMIFASIGCLAFWMTKSWGIRNVLDKAIAILNGVVIPIEFFPEVIKSALSYLPFKFLVYTPVSIYLGRINATESVKQITLQFVWVGIMFFVYKVVWAKGLKKYDSVGN